MDAENAGDGADIFHHYRVLRREDGSLWKLGSGGMGTTYKAIDNNLDALVALKVISAALLDQDSFARDRFIREAKTAAALRHPNAATVYHLGVDSQSYFYAMEFIDGETVEDHVKRFGPFPLGIALALILQATRALAAAHRLGMVHRDIKPANMMLVSEDEGEADTLKLIDFGLAKSLSTAPGHEVSQQSQAFFTPAYASPEQCEALPSDIRSDLYSLGVTLWFMLTGQPTFRGRSVFELKSKHLGAEPPLAELTAADVPAVVQGLLAWMLAKDPAGRPQTPGDLRREIEACQRSLAEHAARTPDVPPYSVSLETVLSGRGKLSWPEVNPLLPGLAAIADDLAAGGGEALAQFIPRRIRAVFPSFQASAAASGDAGPAPAPVAESPADWPAKWPDFHLILLTAEETSVMTMDAATAALPPPPQRWVQDAPQAFAAVVYELLGGKPPAQVPGIPARRLASLGAARNAVLRDAMLGTPPGFGGSAQAVRAALEADGKTGQPDGGRPRRFPVVKWRPALPLPAGKKKALLALGMLGAALLCLAAGLARWNQPRTGTGFSNGIKPRTPGSLLVPQEFLTIQAAINAAQPGETVRVQAGRYPEALLFKTGILLVGESAEKSVVVCPAGASSALTASNCPSGWISDLGFESPEASARQLEVRGIHLVASSVDVRRCRARRLGFGIVCDGGDHSRVQNCEVADCLGEGISVSGADTGAVLSGNRVHDCAGGIEFRFGTGGRAEGNVCEKNVKAGLYAANPHTDVTFSGNQSRGNHADGIAVQKNAVCRIENNVCEHNLLNGIFVRNLPGTSTLTGNQARENTLDGIALLEGFVGVAEGNLCEKNGESGICVKDAGTAPTLRANRCFENGKYGIRVDRFSRPVITKDNVLQRNKIDQYFVDAAAVSPVPAGSPVPVPAPASPPAATPVASLPSLPSGHAAGYVAGTLRVPEDYPGIQAAVDAARPGETVRVRGEFTECVEFKAGINLVGEGAARTLVHAPPGKPWALRALDCGSGWISDIGFDLTERRKGFLDTVCLDNSGVELRRCKTLSVQNHGIFCGFGDHSLVRDCESTGCGENGIFVHGGRTATTLINNWMHDNKLDGIGFNNGASGRLEANLCERNQGCGVSLSGNGSTIVMRANVCRGNARYGLSVSAGTKLDLPAGDLTLLAGNTLGPTDRP